jgi:hypothetical protein
MALPSELFPGNARGSVDDPATAVGDDHDARFLGLDS